MRRIGFALACLLALAFPARAALLASAWTPPASERTEQADERVDPAGDRTAVEAYRRGDLETARSAWSALLDDPSLSAQERGRMLYNLGNVAFRRGAVLEAVGWYSASLRLRPRDVDTWANLEHARAEAKLEPEDRGDLTATGRRLLTSVTLGESEWIVIAAALAWLGLAIGEALRGGRVWRRLSWLGCGVVLVALSPWIYQLRCEGRDPMLVIEPDKVLVKSEPRLAAAVIGEAPAGAEVERLDELPDWTKVGLSGGVEGWVEKKALFALRR